jgi:hypothetical protein
MQSTIARAHDPSSPLWNLDLLPIVAVVHALLALLHVQRVRGAKKRSNMTGFKTEWQW